MASRRRRTIASTGEGDPPPACFSSATKDPEFLSVLVFRQPPIHPNLVWTSLFLKRHLSPENRSTQRCGDRKHGRRQNHDRGNHQQRPALARPKQGFAFDRLHRIGKACLVGEVWLALLSGTCGAGSARCFRIGLLRGRRRVKSRRLVPGCSCLDIALCCRTSFRREGSR